MYDSRVGWSQQQRALLLSNRLWQPCWPAVMLIHPGAEVTLWETWRRALHHPPCEEGSHHKSAEEGLGSGWRTSWRLLTQKQSHSTRTCHRIITDYCIEFPCFSDCIIFCLLKAHNASHGVSYSALAAGGRRLITSEPEQRGSVWSDSNGSEAEVTTSWCVFVSDLMLRHVCRSTTSSRLL